ncbi:DUF3140 domain-containing protein [Roseomonas sp. OT10]|uniref:DUF3140 domain-containing protein n=1 Tax=Roseomonas cutis TaxID=2897332 RepID=UPI001E3439CF|nr:DUF3140 domain-containing protein [Roseomonas sp. OT10]UFN51247.1 DUF3140 domain-containing protein [Roseomonas sp. OT10]
MSAGDDDADAVVRGFREAVNMTPEQLEDWLETDESREVGFTREDETEAVGHQSGRKIVELLRRPAKHEWSEAELAHMRKVTGYVHRHLAQGGPAKDAGHSRWRYSLMNWGHDPLKGEGRARRG